jgi:hypothetical protein
MEETEAMRAPVAHTHRGGMSRNLFLAVAVRSGSNSTYDRDYSSNHDHDHSDHPSDGGGPPAIDLGPATQSGDQHQQDPSGSGADPIPGASGPGDQAPPSPGNGMIPDEGSKSEDTGQDTPLPSPPGSAQPADTGDSVSPPKQDPYHDESPSDTPVLLGPDNGHPSPEGYHSSPEGSGYPDDKGRHGHPDYTDCDEHFGLSLINLMSGNGGDGGDASSGAATRQEPMSLSALLLICT